MTKTKFCPLMLIGFNPPKEKEKDMRVCHPDCAWYNEIEEECAIKTLSTEVTAIRTYAEYDDIQEYSENLWKQNY